ncbi:hypothetical protein EKD04_022575 [Chloroflexales bacterium ZM16-3]|nr:hypothetical protein [Chloroflexales bacterium ZM16-3]
MSRHQHLTELLDKLNSHLTRLADSLEEAALALRIDTTLPDHQLAQQIDAARTDLAELAGQANAQAAHYGLAIDAQSLTSLPAVIALITQITAASLVLEEEQAQARQWLAQVQNLRYNGGSDFEPLAKVQAEAQRLTTALDAGDMTDLPLIIAGTHPLVSLVRLVTEREQLTFEEMDLLDARVRQDLNRMLAVAATSGRLTLVVPIVLMETPQAESHPPIDDTDGNLPRDEVALFNQGNESPNQSEITPDLRGLADTAIANDPDSGITRETTSITTDDQELQELMVVAEDVTEASDGEIPLGEEGCEVADLADLLDALQPLAMVTSEMSGRSWRATPTVISPNETTTESLLNDQSDHEVMEITNETGTAVSKRPILRGIEAPPEGIAERIAYELVMDNTQDRSAAMEQIVWQLLSDNRGGLAYHLVRHLHAQGEALIATPEVVRAVLLGATVCYDIGDTASLLRNDFSLFSPLNNEQDDEMLTTAVILRAASAIRPALLAPNTGAHTILQSLPSCPGLARFSDYCAVIASYGANLKPLNTTNLLLAHDKASWQTELDALQREVRVWSSQANFRTIKFERASRVWKFWQQPNGLIARLMKIVQENDSTQLDLVRHEINRLSDLEEIRHEVHTTERRAIGQTQRGIDPITGAALTQIRQYAGQALDFARRWVVLHSSRPDSKRDYLQQQAEQLRAQVVELQSAVLAELDHYATHQSPLKPPLAAAIACCRRTITHISTLFEEMSELQTEEVLPRYTLHFDLLRSTSITTNDDWEPTLPSDQFELALLDAIIRLCLPWGTVLEEWSVLRDHEMTGRIITGLTALSYPQEEIAQLEQRRSRHLEECRDALHSDIEVTRREIESAVAYGILRETERLNLIADIQAIENELPNTRLFIASHTKLVDIRQDIADERQRRLESTRQRLTSSKIGPDHPAYTRINALLADGDDLTANEYIDMASDGRPLPDPQPERDLFDAFFPDVVMKLSHFLENDAPPRYVERLTNEMRAFAKGNRRN